MNSDQLSVFLRIAASGNLSRTAMETGMSSSGLSRTITALEKELHTRLFHRSGRGLQLTEMGRRLEKHATEIVTLLDNAGHDMAHAVRRGPSGIILAAPFTIARIVFGALGKTLKSEYPGIRVQFREALAREIQEWLATGEIDAAVLYVSAQSAHVKADPVVRSRVSLVAPIGFNGIGDAFPVERLAEVPLVMPTWPNGLRILADSLLAPYSRSLNITMECDASAAITKQLVMDGCGCTILSSASVQDEVNRGVLKAVPLVQPDVFRDVGIVTSQNRPPMPHQWQILDTARHVIRDLVLKGQWTGGELVAK